MDARSAQIATICGCIDHCFAFEVWCNDFANNFDADDIVMGLGRGLEVVSDATRLQSFLALRKLDDFFSGVKAQEDDLVAVNFAFDVPEVLGELGDRFLKLDERETISKTVAHLTNRLSPDPDSEAELSNILKRSLPVFTRLVVALRGVDSENKAGYWLDLTTALIDRGLGR